MNKTTKNNLITYAMVILAFVIMQILISAGSISSLLQGLMVLIMHLYYSCSFTEPGCWYPGRAESWSCRFYVRWCIYKCLLFKMYKRCDRFRWSAVFLALLIGIVTAAIFGMLIGIPVLRLKGDYLAIVTLAFGEIIKNMVNVLYIGKDSKG